MADFLEMLKTEDNFTTTENGAIALKSTKNACLDAFSTLPAARGCPRIISLDISPRLLPKTARLQ